MNPWNIPQRIDRLPKQQPLSDREMREFCSILNSCLKANHSTQNEIRALLIYKQNLLLSDNNIRSSNLLNPLLGHNERANSTASFEGSNLLEDKLNLPHPFLDHALKLRTLNLDNFVNLLTVLSENTPSESPFKNLSGQSANKCFLYLSNKLKSTTKQNRVVNEESDIKKWLNECLTIIESSHFDLNAWFLSQDHFDTYTERKEHDYYLSMLFELYPSHPNIPAVKILSGLLDKAFSKDDLFPFPYEYPRLQRKLYELASDPINQSVILEKMNDAHDTLLQSEEVKFAALLWLTAAGASTNEDLPTQLNDKKTIDRLLPYSFQKPNRTAELQHKTILVMHDRLPAYPEQEEENHSLKLSSNSYSVRANISGVSTKTLNKMSSIIAKLARYLASDIRLHPYLYALLESYPVDLNLLRETDEEGNDFLNILLAQKPRNEDQTAWRWRGKKLWSIILEHFTSPGEESRNKTLLEEAFGGQKYHPVDALRCFELAFKSGHHGAYENIHPLHRLIQDPRDNQHEIDWMITLKHDLIYSTLSVEEEHKSIFDSFFEESENTSSEKHSNISNLATIFIGLNRGYRYILPISFAQEHLNLNQKTLRNAFYLCVKDRNHLKEHLQMERILYEILDQPELKLHEFYKSPRHFFPGNPISHTSLMDLVFDSSNEFEHGVACRYAMLIHMKTLLSPEDQAKLLSQILQSKAPHPENERDHEKFAFYARRRMVFCLDHFSKTHLISTYRIGSEKITALQNLYTERNSLATELEFTGKKYEFFWRLICCFNLEPRLINQGIEPNTGKTLLMLISEHYCDEDDAILRDLLESTITYLITNLYANSKSRDLSGKTVLKQLEIIEENSEGQRSERAKKLKDKITKLENDYRNVRLLNPVGVWMSGWLFSLPIFLMTLSSISTITLESTHAISGLLKRYPIGSFIGAALFSIFVTMPQQANINRALVYDLQGSDGAGKNICPHILNQFFLQRLAGVDSKAKIWQRVLYFAGIIALLPVFYAMAQEFFHHVGLEDRGWAMGGSMTISIIGAIGSLYASSDSFHGRELRTLSVDFKYRFLESMLCTQIDLSESDSENELNEQENRVNQLHQYYGILHDKKRKLISHPPTGKKILLKFFKVMILILCYGYQLGTLFFLSMNSFSDYWGGDRYLERRKFQSNSFESWALLTLWLSFIGLSSTYARGNFWHALYHFKDNIKSLYKLLVYGKQDLQSYELIGCLNLPNATILNLLKDNKILIHAEKPREMSQASAGNQKPISWYLLRDEFGCYRRGSLTGLEKNKAAYALLQKANTNNQVTETHLQLITSSDTFLISDEILVQAVKKIIINQHGLSGFWQQIAAWVILIFGTTTVPLMMFVISNTPSSDAIHWLSGHSTHDKKIEIGCIVYAIFLAALPHFLALLSEIPDTAEILCGKWDAEKEEQNDAPPLSSTFFQERERRREDRNPTPDDEEKSSDSLITVAI